MGEQVVRARDLRRGVLAGENAPVRPRGGLKFRRSTTGRPTALRPDRSTLFKPGKKGVVALNPAQALRLSDRGGESRHAVRVQRVARPVTCTRPRCPRPRRRCRIRSRTSRRWFRASPPSFILSASGKFGDADQVPGLGAARRQGPVRRLRGMVDQVTRWIAVEAKGDGVLPGCVTSEQAQLRAVLPIPELSTSTKLLVSYYLPGDGPGVKGHPHPHPPINPPGDGSRSVRVAVHARDQCARAGHTVGRAFDARAQPRRHGISTRGNCMRVGTGLKVRVGAISGGELCGASRRSSLPSTPDATQKPATMLGPILHADETATSTPRHATRA